MTVCNLCKGTGKLLKPWYNTMGAMTGMTGDICFMCDGKGTIGEPLTNEEYLKSCNTEQLAEEIYGFVWCCNELWQRLCCSGDGTDKESDLKIVREWLKQPHNS